MMILNQWDVQSKHIHTTDGVASPLYAGECRYGGGEMYVLVVGEDEQDKDQENQNHNLHRFARW